MRVIPITLSFVSGGTDFSFFLSYFSTSLYFLSALCHTCFSKEFLLCPLESLISFLTISSCSLVLCLLSNLYWCCTNTFYGIFKEVEPFGRSFLLDMNFFLCLELHQGCSLSQRSGQCSMALCFWSLPGDNVSVSSVLSFHLNFGPYCGDKQEDALQTCGKHGIDLHHIEK